MSQRSEQCYTWSVCDTGRPVSLQPEVSGVGALRELKKIKFDILLSGFSYFCPNLTQNTKENITYTNLVYCIADGKMINISTMMLAVENIKI